MDHANHGSKLHLINAVSHRVGLSQKRIREYEKLGLIRPKREPRTNNRLFAEADILRLQRVKVLLHEHGFTLACLKHFLVSAPCWTIFDCRQKASCRAYQLPHMPCYEAVLSDREAAGRSCADCPVFINRHTERFALLERP